MEDEFTLALRNLRTTCAKHLHLSCNIQRIFDLINGTPSMETLSTIVKLLENSQSQRMADLSNEFKDARNAFLAFLRKINASSLQRTHRFRVQKPIMQSS